MADSHSRSHSHSRAHLQRQRKYTVVIDEGQRELILLGLGCVGDGEFGELYRMVATLPAEADKSSSMDPVHDLTL